MRRPLVVLVSVVVFAATTAVGVVLAPVTGAATIVVTTTADTTGGPGVSLRDAVTAALGNAIDDTIVLDGTATYQLTDCVAGQLAYDDDDDLIVEGNGATIIQTCPGERIFFSDDSEPAPMKHGRIDLRDLTLDVTADGSITYGSVIHAGSPLRLERVTVSGVHAPGSSLIYGGYDTGPSVTWHLEILDSDFVGNTGTSISGSFASLWLFDSRVQDNTGTGVSGVDMRPLLVEDSTITGNTGRGLSNTGQSGSYDLMTVTGSTISDNQSGGITCSYCGTIDISDSFIERNGFDEFDVSPPFGAGGVSMTTIRQNPGVRSLTITHTEIRDNQVDGDGGGVRFRMFDVDFDDTPHTLVSISDSIIEGNEASGHGGGVSVNSSDVTIANATIDGNIAGEDGGGVHIIETAPGGPYVSTITGGSVSANTAADDGGGLFVDQSELTMDGVDVDVNQAIGDGGGLFLGAGIDPQVIGGRFVENEAGGNGGGIKAEGVLFLQVDGTTMVENVAADDGGAIASLNVGQLDVLDAQIEANTATTGSGGGMRVAGDGFRVEGTTLAVNTAGDVGGGLSAFGAGGVVRNATISGNDANAGGGIDFDGAGFGFLDLVHVTLADNTADGGGTQIVHTSGSVDVEASAIVLPGGGPSCNAPVSSTARSVLADASCGSSGTDLVTAVDPEVGALTDNGGPTLTRLPAGSSPLLDHAPAPCALGGDQRGLPRPAGTGCDAGAVEVVVAMVMGTEGKDELDGSEGPDEIWGLGGKDHLRGFAGNDLLFGGDERDKLEGGDGDDELHGGDGPDHLDGGPGADLLVGGPGDDVLIGDEDDIFDAGPGDDVCIIRGRGRIPC